jgi:uncharacterized protein
VSATRSERLARFQVRHAATIAVAALLVTIACLPRVRALELRSEWVDLLPRSAPSVQDLHAGEQRVRGTSTLTVVASSRSPDALRRYAAALGPRLDALPPSLGVYSVQWNVSAWQSFVRAHRFLFAPLSELTEARDRLRERIAYERASALPGFVNLDDPPESTDALIARARAQLRRVDDEAARFPGGFLMRPGGRHLAIFLRTDIPAGEAARAGTLVRRVEAEIARLPVTGFAPDLEVSIAGDLRVALLVHDSIEHELVIATLLTVGLCVLAIFGLFRTPRAVVLLGASVAVPVVVTFALTQLTIGHLNASTAFLGSIVIGNGINPGIVWLARYFEERRGGGDLVDAIARAHHGVWAGTFTASLAASLSYGSLMVTDFRGFHDFGVIGAMGMVLCWALTLLVLPSLVSLWERWRPLPMRPSGTSNPYGVWFARAARRAPVALALTSAALALAGAVLGIVAIARDPLDYNFRHLTTVRADITRASDLNGVAGDIVGRTGNGSAIAVLVARREDAAPLRAALEDLRDRHGAPFGAVRSLDDLIPDAQPAKLAVLADLRRLMLEARAHASPSTQRDLDAAMPPADLRLLGDDDVPAAAALLFSERDGARGRMLFVEEQRGAVIWDGRYMIAWANAIRSARVVGRAQPLVVGSAPVYADMITAVVRDGPLAIVVSLAATTLLVLLSFRRGLYRALTLLGLFTGIAWMAGLMTLLKIRLNFLNFVALPITFGIGVDYAVNVVRRYAQEVDEGTSRDPIEAAVQETGGAIVVCSLTTIFGYCALLTSANRALNSFGLAAVLGELACVLATTLGLSSVLVLLERRRVGRTHRDHVAPKNARG